MKLTELVTGKDGTIRTRNGRKVDAMPIGKPFSVRTVGVMGRNPDKTYLERELKRRQGFDAYAVGKGSHGVSDDAPRGLPVDEVTYYTFPVQAYKVVRRD